MTRALTVQPTIALKPPVSREELLQHTEQDPEGADELIEFLREARRDPGPRPIPE